jgi:EAL domain-containing protein (putative c-di-GMP-specific phosphodiesterase class I)
VTAEGVESTAQRETLLSQGCDEAQGHLFSRALSAEEAAALLGTQDEHAARSEMH